MQLAGYEDIGDVEPAPVARVETLRSIWLIDRDTYVRMPKVEEPDSSRVVPSDWNRLEDLRRLPHRRAWWSHAPGGVVVARILPVAGPVDGSGIITGPVVAVAGLGPADPLHGLDLSRLREGA